MLGVIDTLFSKIWNCSKMIGDYNNNGLELKLDKLIGGNTVCLGLKHIEGKNMPPLQAYIIIHETI